MSRHLPAILALSLSVLIVVSVSRPAQGQFATNTPRPNQIGSGSFATRPPQASPTSAPTLTPSPLPSATPTMTTAPTLTPLPTLTPAAAIGLEITEADLRELEDLIFVALSTLEGRTIEARIADGRPNGGEIGAVIGYVPSVDDLNLGSLEVMIALMTALAVDTEQILDAVSIVVGDPVTDEALYIVGLSLDSLEGYDFDTITLSEVAGLAEFLDLTGRGTVPSEMITAMSTIAASIPLTTTPGTPQQPPATTAAAAGPAASTLTPIPQRVVFTQALANLRTCPQTSCEVVIQLGIGQQLTITASMLGDEGFAGTGNRLWYATTYNNLPVVVYSGVVGDTNPVVSVPVSGPAGNVVNVPVVVPGATLDRCPVNCDEARLRGVSPERAAQCGLDRDRDGVACYGD